MRFLAILTRSQSVAFAISARFCSPWLTDSVWCWAQHRWIMGQSPCHTGRLGEWCNDMQVRSHLESYLRGSHLLDKWKISENRGWWEEVKWKYEWWLRLLESKAFNNKKNDNHKPAWKYMSFFNKFAYLVIVHPAVLLFLLFRQLLSGKQSVDYDQFGQCRLGWLHWCYDGVSGLYFVWPLAARLSRLESRANMMNTGESC